MELTEDEFMGLSCITDDDIAIKEPIRNLFPFMNKLYELTTAIGHEFVVHDSDPHARTDLGFYRYSDGKPMVISMHQEEHYFIERCLCRLFGCKLKIYEFEIWIKDDMDTGYLDVRDIVSPSRLKVEINTVSGVEKIRYVSMLKYFLSTTYNSFYIRRIDKKLTEEICRIADDPKRPITIDFDHNSDRRCQIEALNIMLDKMIEKQVNIVSIDIEYLVGLDKGHPMAEKLIKVLETYEHLHALYSYHIRFPTWLVEACKKAQWICTISCFEIEYEDVLRLYEILKSNDMISLVSMLDYQGDSDSLDMQLLTENMKIWTCEKHELYKTSNQFLPIHNKIRKIIEFLLVEESLEYMWMPRDLIEQDILPYIWVNQSSDMSIWG